MAFQLFIGGLGGPELVIVFMLVVLLFGASKLPKLARASGEAMGEFKRGREDLENDIRDATNMESVDESAPASATTDADGETTAAVDADTDRGTDAVVESDADVDDSPVST